jgi:hypothetical protein
MRAAGIEGLRRGKRVRTTKPDLTAGRHPDLVKRNHRERAEPVVGHGSDIRAHLGRSRVCLLHRGRLLPHDRRVAGSFAHAYHHGARCVGARTRISYSLCGEERPIALGHGPLSLKGFGGFGPGSRYQNESLVPFHHNTATIEHRRGDIYLELVTGRGRRALHTIACNRGVRCSLLQPFSPHAVYLAGRGQAWPLIEQNHLGDYRDLTARSG